MAIMNATQRRQCWADSMTELPGTIGVTKADLRAAIDAIDSWVDSNAASLNTAIPLPARTSLSASQKAKLLAMVVLRRFRENV